MNKNNPLLKEALRLSRLKRHDDAALVLERLAAVHNPDLYALFLLAVEFLQAGAIDRIEPVLKKIRSVDRNYPPLVRLELFLSLKSAESPTAALTRYIDALQRFPNDRYIIRAISGIRRAHDFQGFQRSARLSDYVPLENPAKKHRSFTPPVAKLRRRLNKKWLLVACIVPAIVLLLFAFVRHGGQIIGLFRPDNRPSRVDFGRIDMATIDGSRHDLVDKIRRHGTPVFYYSNEEVLADFNNARAVLKREGYNEALVLINKILNSNAGFSVKERAEFLKKYTLSIDERVYEPLPFKKVEQSPYLYGGVAVEWNGAAANVKRKEGKLLFNLMMGKGPANTFSGIADVYAEKDSPGLSNGDRVLVRALFLNNPGGSSRPYLVAKEVLSGERGPAEK